MIPHIEGDGIYPNWVVEFTQEIYDDLQTRLSNLIMIDQSTGEKFSFSFSNYDYPTLLDGRMVHLTSVMVHRLQHDGEVKVQQ